MPESSNQPQTISDQKSLNWKNIIIGIIIGAILVGLVVGIFLILQPKPTEPVPVITKKATPSATTATPSTKKDETADWKLYKNQENNFQIKIPEGWHLTDKYCDGTKRNHVVLDRNPLDPCTGLIQLPGAGELAVYVGNEFESVEVLPECKKTQENIEVAGVKAVKYYGPEKPCVFPSFSTTKIFFNYKRSGYQIEFLNTDSKGSHDPIYDQILSTFKFLD